MSPDFHDRAETLMLAVGMSSTTCHLCEQQDGRAEFCIQVKNVGIGTDGSAHRWLNLRGRACERCHAELKSLHLKRQVIGIVALLVAFTGWYPLWLLFADTMGRLSMLVAMVIAALPFVGVFLWVGSVERRLIEQLRAGSAVEQLRDILPEVGGVFGWRELRVFPALPRGQSFVSLDEVGSLIGQATGKGASRRDDVEDRLERIRKWKEKEGLANRPKGRG